MSPKHVGFLEAISLFFRNCFNFTDRSTRSEYWWVVLFQFILGFAIGLLSTIIGADSNSIVRIVQIVFFVPNLSLTIRRLHDTGKSWVYVLIALIPLAGYIVLIVWLAMDSEFDNIWGPCADNNFAGGNGNFYGGFYNNQPYNNNNGNPNYNPNYNNNPDFNSDFTNYGKPYDPNQGYYNPNQYNPQQNNYNNYNNYNNNYNNYDNNYNNYDGQQDFGVNKPNDGYNNYYDNNNNNNNNNNNYPPY